MTAERFSSEGYNSIAIDGKTPQNEREEAMAAFREGKVRILCNCELFGEGLDVPDCECGAIKTYAELDVVYPTVNALNAIYAE